MAGKLSGKHLPNRLMPVVNLSDMDAGRVVGAVQLCESFSKVTALVF